MVGWGGERVQQAVSRWQQCTDRTFHETLTDRLWRGRVTLGSVCASSTVRESFLEEVALALGQGRRERRHILGRGQRCWGLRQDGAWHTATRRVAEGA